MWITLLYPLPFWLILLKFFKGLFSSTKPRNWRIYFSLPDPINVSLSFQGQGQRMGPGWSTIIIACRYMTCQPSIEPVVIFPSLYPQIAHWGEFENGRWQATLFQNVDQSWLARLSSVRHFMEETLSPYSTCLYGC